MLKVYSLIITILPTKVAYFAVLKLCKSILPQYLRHHKDAVMF